MANLQSTTTTGTDSVKFPAGNEAQKPGTPATGMTRWNTDYRALEVYDGDAWRRCDRTNVSNEYQYYYCFVTATVYYGAIYDNTTIYELNGNSRTSLATITTAPSTGSITMTAGRIYFATKPVGFVASGRNDAFTSVEWSGQNFIGYSTRYGTSNYRFYSVGGNGTLNVYDNRANGINDSPTSTLALTSGSQTDYNTNTEAGYVYFTSDTPVIATVGEADGGDFRMLVPASEHIYTRIGQNLRTMTGGTNYDTHVVNKGGGGTVVYIGSPDLVANTSIGDGAGGDSMQHIPLHLLRDTYVYGGLLLSDYQISTPYEDVTIVISYWDGSNWQVGETHSLSGSVTEPDEDFREAGAGFNAVGDKSNDFGGGSYGWLADPAILFKWEGNKPFSVVVNDQNADEEHLIGWNSYNGAIQY